MAHTLKIVLLTLLGLLLLAVAGAVVLLLTFDPNRYKGEIAQAVEARTGRQLTIEGDLRLTLFPWLGVESGTVVLGNAPGFGDAPFARLDAVEVRVRIVPLLRRELEMGKVVVRGLVLNLARDAAGRPNWADLVATAATPTEAGPEAAGGKGGAPPPAGVSVPPPAVSLPVVALAIGGLEVRDAALVWDDRQASQHVAVDHFNLESGPLRLGAPIHLDLAGDVAVSQPELAGHLEGAVIATVDLDQQTFALQGVHLTAHLEGAALPGGKADGTVAAEVAGDLKGGHVEVRNLDFAASAPGAVARSGHLTAPLLAVDLPGPRLEAKEVHLEGKAEGATLPGRRLEGTMDAGVAVDLGQHTAVVRDLHLTALDLDLRGALHATGLPARPVASGSLQLATFDPRALLARLGWPVPETADAQVLHRARLTSEVEVAADHLRLDNLKVVVDETTISGWVALPAFAGPAVRAALTVDQIDADRYLPPAKPAARAGDPPAAAAPVATPATAAAAAATLPVEPLRKLDVDATVRVGRLKAAGLRVADLLVTLRGKGGELRLNPATAKLYGGAYAGDAQLDVTSALPRLALHDRFTAIQLGPLLQDATGKQPATGTATLEARLHAAGSDRDALVASLGGDGQFAIQNGALAGVDLGQILRDAAALLHGRPAAARGAGDKSDFSEVTGTFQAANGVVRNRDLAGKAPAVRFRGAGEASLVAEHLDYLLTATVVESRTGQGGKEAAELKGVEIPIRISGPFATPEVHPDLRAALKGQAGKVVGQRVEKEVQKRLKDKVPEQLQHDLQDSLKGLFR